MICLMRSYQVNTELCLCYYVYMKICFFGIYDPTYSRNDILLSGLREIGVEVIECRADWQDPKRYRKLWKSLRSSNDQYDYIYAAYPSPVPTILARILSKKPVITDAFYSMFDSVVNDRQKLPMWHPKSIKLLILDWISIMLAHLVITDTQEHKKYWSKWFLVKAEKIHTVYLGVNEKIFYPIQAVKKDFIQVHFHGTYIPLQGTQKIIEAAKLCTDNSNIHFRLIGNGRTFEGTKKLAVEYGLNSIEFISDKISLDGLNQYMAETDIILGIFGNNEKSRRVIPNKVFEGLAAKKAVITMDTPAVREIFSDRDLFIVMNEPASIASAIKTLAKDEKLRTGFAQHGYDTVCRYRPEVIAKSLVDIISK